VGRARRVRDHRAELVRAGDEFTSGDGRRFRIVGIVGVPDDVGIYNALWKVESVPD
jgi:hypothetical protein